MAPRAGATRPGAGHGLRPDLLLDQEAPGSPLQPASPPRGGEPGELVAHRSSGRNNRRDRVTPIPLAPSSSNPVVPLHPLVSGGRHRLTELPGPGVTTSQIAWFTRGGHVAGATPPHPTKES